VDESAVDWSEWLRPVGETLDEMGLAMCVLDPEEAALAWNRTFLRFFPEHAAAIHVGEPYRENLRRFYAGRLAESELDHLDRYIADGVARHRAQQRPFSFEHRGRGLQVGCVDLPGVGRMRLWRDVGSPRVDRASSDSGPVRHEAMLDMIPDGLSVLSSDGVLHWVNARFVVLYGLSDAQAAIGHRFEEVYHAACADRPAPWGETGIGLLLDRLRFAGAPFEIPLPHDRWIRVKARLGAGGSICMTHVDITPLRREQRRAALAEQQARLSEARLLEKSRLLEATLERMNQGIVMVTPEGIVEVCNRRAIELLELPEALMRSKPRFEEVLAFQWSRDEFRHTAEDIKTFVRSGGILDTPHSYDRKRPNGTVIEIESVPIEGGGVLRTYTDVTEKRRTEDRIRFLAQHDPLTGLLNRASFTAELGDAVARAAADERERFALLFLDLDGFKPINDLHGHAAGDRVLVEVASRLRRVIRTCDAAARLGGDEFAVLQGRVACSTAAGRLQARIEAAVARPIDSEWGAVRVTVSIGSAVFGADGRDAESLLHRADQAMYAAKRARALGAAAHPITEAASPRS
jgi:diguanylate cyclase (GGDEF)-like protein